MILSFWIMKSRDPMIMISENSWSVHISIFRYGP